MRVVRILIALACIALGAIVGALNRQSILIDFGAFQTTTTLGVALLVALLLGVVLGGLAIAVTALLPLRRRLSRAERGQAPPTATPGL